MPACDTDKRVRRRFIRVAERKAWRMSSPLMVRWQGIDESGTVTPPRPPDGHLNETRVERVRFRGTGEVTPTSRVNVSPRAFGGAMHFVVGTSGYSYPKWKGSFYPKKLPQKEMLSYYSQRFCSVEINTTFRALPEVSVLESWAQQVPDGFRFVLKAPQTISHHKRLKNAEDDVDCLLRAASALQERRGPLLFQLPPNFKKDLPRLEAFLGHVGPVAQAAFEFRHQSWFADDVFDCLRANSCALCVADMDEFPAPSWSAPPVGVTCVYGAKTTRISVCLSGSRGSDLRTGPQRSCFSGTRILELAPNWRLDSSNWPGREVTFSAQHTRCPRAPCPPSASRLSSGVCSFSGVEFFDVSAYPAVPRGRFETVTP
jgi:hypothetical protein